MIKKVIFSNYRNLTGSYDFDGKLNVVFGKNSTGKSNLLDGIKLVFNSLIGNYSPVYLSDFFNSDDTRNIEIDVVLERNSIPSLVHLDSNGNEIFGFKLIVKRTESGKYIKQIRHLSGSQIDLEIVREDSKLPKIHEIPLQRIEDILSSGLILGITQFIESEDKYREIVKDSKINIKNQIRNKEDKFINLCNKFNQNLRIELSNPKLSNEKLYLVDGDKEHNIKIGSGYKSVANILINSINEEFNIIVIDEIENHLHPALIRSLVREIRSIPNIQVITTTHSPVVVNEMLIEELIDISGTRLSTIGNDLVIKKLNKFLHPGRNELIFADNIVLVEGYSEEILFKHYLLSNNKNWTIINVGGVMFEPYILLAKLLMKKIVVVSDNDYALSTEKMKSQRFLNLEEICVDNKVKLIEIDNTLESDLNKNGFIDSRFDKLLTTHELYNDIKIAKEKMKTTIADKIADLDIDLSEWHVIKGIENEFENN
ncbi:MAG: AAA family ATPase [Acholeplasma sp.]|nr:AAA family ATPase [Acholeplasma sp.]